jgi:hypothetical protein
MILEDLKKSISKMSTEELTAAILELRASRRTRKEKPAAKKAAVKAAVKATSSVEKLVAELSLEKRQKLLALLGGKDG